METAENFSWPLGSGGGHEAPEPVRTCNCQAEKHHGRHVGWCRSLPDFDNLKLLSRQELFVLCGVARGHEYDEIALAIYKSRSAVCLTARRAKHKLGLLKTSDVIQFCWRNKLVE